MVVTRRTPVVPYQPLARNPSSRPTQRPPPSSHADVVDVSKNTTSSVATSSLAGSSHGDSDHHNGLDNDAVQKTKRTRRRNKGKYQKSNFQAFLDFLTKLLLLAFTIYTFSVCPQDTHLQSPICRGLAEYKRIVLDPYIIPPIQAMLIHPSVAPHIERVKPYVHRAVEITAPILLRTQQEWNLHIVPQWEKRIVPEWNKRAVPLWNRYVVPQWDEHVVPRIQLLHSKAEPYRLSFMQEYNQHFASRAQMAFYSLQRWQRQAEPYVLLAASKTKQGYYAAKPYAIPLASKCGHLLQQFALFLQEQCQKFVDPHIARMWEKVKELSSGQVISETTSEPLSENLFTVLETLEYETLVSPIHSLTPAYDATPTPKETDAADISLSSATATETVDDSSYFISAEPTITPEPHSEASTEQAAVPTGVESFLNAESFHNSEPLTSGASAFVEELDATATTVTWSRAPSAVDERTESPAPVTLSKISVPAASATVPPVDSRADEEEEMDLDAFYADLGLDEPLGNPSSSKEYKSAPPRTRTETEQERTDRLRLKAEETARKRADIEARQGKWEAELEAQMERGTSQLQAGLNDLRAAAAAELASSAEVRNSIEELVSESEKYIKGTEIYLKNLRRQNRRPEEKLALWDRVADRVNDKFNERLSATEGVVNAWYRVILDKELQEVLTVTAEVREVAEKGQLDLGLDYAWLEDVTYNDWQRYHNLITTSERYAQEAASIQNGTHAKVVVTNPMEAIFADLESEIQDVVIGFETRMRRIKRDGERAFNNHGNGVVQREEEKGTMTNPKVEADPQVSILPVPREKGFIPPVVIGRSQDEVLEALGKVEPGGEGDRVVSGSNVDAKEAVSRLIQEMEGGAMVDHTEL